MELLLLTFMVFKSSINDSSFDGYHAFYQSILLLALAYPSKLLDYYLLMWISQFYIYTIYTIENNLLILFIICLKEN